MSYAKFTLRENSNINYETNSVIGIDVAFKDGSVQSYPDSYILGLLDTLAKKAKSITVYANDLEKPREFPLDTWIITGYDK